ncbi:bactofilin family protein [Vibrio ulleungensis]|jgi:cytoskeletal protein CcmA (bactofilin family)|uniref:Polymer-forming cytoskeletal protein n=1 Tax=Vibrio ulleungensis TaxID=2807619 RepID=A0ABS2HBF3_9VIBR|nr:polymer-forming cytoskeletal protein [Vibrio ulleungensis]MBM7034925.1 polymer-forming cytoskeletal protein [Vibrio ulleungensis]
MGLFGKNGRAKSKQSTTTLIADGCFITGELRLETDIQVDGEVQGKIQAEKTLIISPSGHLVGDGYAKLVIVNGRVEGALHAEAVEILRHGAVSGTIFTDDLSIERGGKFNGETLPYAVDGDNAPSHESISESIDEQDGDNRD